MACETERLRVVQAEAEVARLEERLSDLQEMCGAIDDPVGNEECDKQLQELEQTVGLAISRMDRARTALRNCEAPAPVPPRTLTTTGLLAFLRVHDSGGFGDPATGDFIDGEVAFGLEPTSVGLEPRCREFGFQLRNDDRGPAHQGMLDLLRDAFVNELSVRVDYQQDSLPDGTPKQHSKPFRITVLRGL